MTARKALFWLHLGAGLAAGLVIFVMSVTGVLLTYEKQMVAWADGYRVAPSAGSGARRLGVEQLLAAARRSDPGAVPASLTIASDPGAPAAIGLGRAGTVFVDPYTGEVLGRGSQAIRAFFRHVTDWHRWLAVQGEARAAAREVTGASNLLFLFIVLSGIVLWWPRSWSAPAIRSITLFRSGLAGKARDFSWHNVIGIWSWATLVLVVASAATISYPWAGDLLYRIAGEQPPARRTVAGARGQGSAPVAGSERPPAGIVLDGLNAAWASAEAQVAGWTSITLRVPPLPDAALAFTIDSGAGAIRPDRRAQLTVDRRTAAVLRFEPYAGQSLGRRLRSWPRWVHTGEAAGLLGQTLAGLASLGGAVLVWTGWALALRRFGAWRARRRESAPERATGQAVAIRGASDAG
jgi:uncharacterized iron-regulated membrane protein